MGTIPYPFTHLKLALSSSKMAQKHQKWLSKKLTFWI
jgi:hypothetical protein